MDFHAPSYTEQKHTDSAYALLQAASLPYESFSERSGEVVPCLFAGPEAQLTDIVTTDLVVDPLLRGFVEVTCEPQVAMRMTSNVPDTPTPDDCQGIFIFQFSPEGNAVPFSSFLDRPSSRLRSVQSDVDGKIALVVATSMTGTVRIIRENITGLLPLLLVNFEYSPAPGAWVTATGNPPVLMEDLVITLSVSIPSTCIAVRFVCAMQQPKTTQMVFNVSLLPDSGTYFFPAVWSTLRPHQFPFLRELPPTQLFRRIAQDVLVTWTGSTLDNGGKIAIGLTPNQFCPILGETPYGAVAALRANRYDGPIKAGAHGTWRPGALRDLDHQSVFTYTPATLKLVVGYDFAENTGSARIRTFGMFGFVSDNPIIGRMVWTPAITPAMQEALGLYFQSCPACTNNKDHTVLKSLKSGMKTGVRGLRALLEQDDKIAALAMMAGQPEIAAAVKVAGKINRSIPKKPLAVQSASKPAGKQKKKKQSF